MQQYIIISLSENHLSKAGHVIIVKANPLNYAHADGLSQMFGKTYFSFSQMETNETETFVLPFTEEKWAHIKSFASQQLDTETFWTPDFDDYVVTKLRHRNGSLEDVHISRALTKQLKEDRSRTFIPPVGEFQFRHNQVGQLGVIRFQATETKLEEYPDGSFSWDSGDLCMFVFPDDERTEALIEEAMALDPHKKQFWRPDLNKFHRERIRMVSSGPINSSYDMDLYISNRLPVNIIMNNMQDALA